MNVIACEYGKYASIDVDWIIRYRTRMNRKGEFANKDESIYFELVPIIGWVIDDKLHRNPILVNNEKHNDPAIYDIEKDEWWFDADHGRKLNSLIMMIKQTIESDIEYRIENPDEECL